MRALNLYQAAVNLHESLQLCFDQDRELCSLQNFEDIANALLGAGGDHGMSNLNSLAYTIRSMEKSLIEFNYKE
jgi:hypothetical protein